MKKHNILILFLLPLLIVSCVFAQRYMTLEELKNMKKKPNAEKNVEANKEKPKDVPKDMKVPPRPGMTMTINPAETLAEGSYSKIEKPFIFIARSAEDYEHLKNLVEGFSSDKEIDFKKQAVIAVFAGMKSTGGYSFDIRKVQGRTDVILNSPPADAMVTQAITYPYKIGVIDIQEEDVLNIKSSSNLVIEREDYAVIDGEIEFEGGFIGRQTKFKPVGNIRVFKHENFITFEFDVRGEGDQGSRTLKEFSSGILNDNSVTISRLEAGNFIDRPHPPFIVSAKFEERKLLMSFEPGKRDYVVSDGFVGRGNLVAIKVNPKKPL